MTSTENAAPPANRPKPPSPEAALGKLLKAGVDGSLAYLRKIDPDAAADVDTERRRDVQRPRIVVVGETNAVRAASRTC